MSADSPRPLLVPAAPARPPAEASRAESEEEKEHLPAAMVWWEPGAAAALAATQFPVRQAFKQAVPSPGLPPDPSQERQPLPTVTPWPDAPLPDQVRTNRFGQETGRPGTPLVNLPQVADSELHQAWDRRFRLSTTSLTTSEIAEPCAWAQPPEVLLAVAPRREALSSSSHPLRDIAVAEAAPASRPTENEPAAPVAIADAHPAVAGHLEKVFEQVRSWNALGEVGETLAPRPVPPASELAFTARLTDEGPQRARSELLAVLTSLGPAARYTETAPPKFVPALEIEPVPAAELPARVPAPPAASAAAVPPVGTPAEPETNIAPELRRESGPEKPPKASLAQPQPPSRTAEADEPPTPRRAAEPADRPPASAERPQPRGLAVARGQAWHELPEESRTVPRSVAVLGHPVHTEPHTPPMAPYRAPEFVASQPGTRTPWSTPAEPPAPSSDAPPSPVHGLSLVIPPSADEAGPQEAVMLRVVERAGEVKVAVHTRDAELAESLREQLGDLVQSLERSGYRTEAWTPGEPLPENSRPQDLAAERDSAGDRRGDQPESGHHSSRQQRQRQQDQPHWAESLAAAALGYGALSHRQEELK